MNKKTPKMFAVLPTLLTLGNAACGFGAITFAAKVGPAAVGGNELFIAGGLIFLGMVCDMLDGSVARAIKQESEFGAQLDSLCDAITFGVAPAFLMIQFTLHNYIKEDQYKALFQYHPRLLWVIAVLFALCALLRLARFNVETDEEDSHEGFSGLPSPAAAGAVASFPIAMGGLYEMASNTDATGQKIAAWLIPVVITLLPLITLGVAMLMVSRISYTHVFSQLLQGNRSRKHFIQLVFTLAVVFVVQEMAVPLIFCYFAFAAPIIRLWEKLKSGVVYKSSHV
ncbi:CDP-diacylglycerol--serine O-phosphatidyltransferase [hydrothermal vent metagenome]|uniref:CDP-diacylglycerol--serine O-phosphatidyltransferase n=1 Tax=hydrothermal vent metagenome TaxID=652676 RepID=A0A3B1DJ46_9ZZZZ